MLYNIAAVPLNIDWQQILLHLLNFVILFAGLYLLLCDREIEEKRAAAKKELDHYEQMRKSAAEEEADAILAEARKKAAEEKRHALRAARREISALVSDATEKLVLKETAQEAYDQFLNAADDKHEEPRA